MSKAKLTAMVSVYKSSRWLRDRIGNLMETHAFKRGDLLIFLANASSPDPEDEAICGEYARVQNIRYEKIPFCTVYAAWNHIIKNTNTPFLANANSDDLVSPDCYDVLMQLCGSAHLVYCDWITIGEEVRRWNDVAGGAGNGIGHYNPDNDQISCGHFPLWRRELHDKIGLFDPWYQALGDADIWIRSWRAGIRDFTPVNSPLAAYRWRDGQNLWNRIDDSRRGEEWARLHSRTGERLEF